LRKNSWGIPEPDQGIEVPAGQLEVVFIPLLAWDKRGHRVGYGKGFYDNFLSACKPEVIKIGLSLFEAVEAIEGIRPEDIPMDYCVHPEGITAFPPQKV
jgi:5-formyltetrahydrofolate cyclo-ligase